MASSTAHGLDHRRMPSFPHVLTFKSVVSGIAPASIAGRRRVDAADATAPKPRFHLIQLNPSLRTLSSNHSASDSCPGSAAITLQGYGDGRRFRPSRRRGVARRWPVIRRCNTQPNRPFSSNDDAGGWPCMYAIDPMRGFYVGLTIAAAIVGRATMWRRPWSPVPSREVLKSKRPRGLIGEQR